MPVESGADARPAGGAQGAEGPLPGALSISSRVVEEPRMVEHRSVVVWSRDCAAFTDNRYSRAHRWLFDGGVEVPASSSPQLVPLPMSVSAAVDPEEAFVASLSSCHMLWFLSIASRRGFVVDGYRDEAVGVMGTDEFGRSAMTRVTLHPDVEFLGDRRPSANDVVALHGEAHDNCFLARSVKAEVRCEPIGM